MSQKEAVERIAELSARAHPPGWYTDPSGNFEQRYWTGTTWTVDVKGRRLRKNTGQAAFPTGSHYGMAALVPLASLVLGFVALTKNRVGPAIALFLLTPVPFVVWTTVLVAIGIGHSTP